jgi:hypothetical protein
VYAGARETVMAVAGHQGIPVLDMTQMSAKALEVVPIRDLVKFILETPPRCAILVSLDNKNDNETCLQMQKVVTRLSKQQLDIRFRRVVFCVTTSADRLPTGVQSAVFPGTTDDKVQMLLYRMPPAFVSDEHIVARLRPIAEAMVDYSVFQPRIWCHVVTGGTVEDFLSTLTFQVHRRSDVDLDTTLDTFPSFEAGWRRSFSADLQNKLKPMPDTTCRGIHRVLPAGVSQQDAIKSIQTALPLDLTDAYALTVASTATDDQCGSIYITQRTHHVMVNIQCTVDPGIMSQVCSELRTGHRLIAQELSQTNARLTSLETGFKTEIEILKELIVGEKRPQELDSRQCTKKSCINLVDDRFANGRWKKQCPDCIVIANQARKKQRLSHMGRPRIPTVCSK